MRRWINKVLPSQKLQRLLTASGRLTPCKSLNRGLCTGNKEEAHFRDISPPLREVDAPPSNLTQRNHCNSNNCASYAIYLLVKVRFISSHSFSFVKMSILMHIIHMYILCIINMYYIYIFKMQLVALMSLKCDPWGELFLNANSDPLFILINTNVT